MNENFYNVSTGTYPAVLAGLFLLFSAENYGAILAAGYNVGEAEGTPYTEEGLFGLIKVMNGLSLDD